MTHEISPELEALLQLATSIRKDHEEAKWRARAPYPTPYPETLSGYVRQVKALVGDWEDIWAPEGFPKRATAMVYTESLRHVLQKWMTRSQALFPERLSIDEAKQIFADEPRHPKLAPGDEIESKFFWSELVAADDMLKLRLLAIKYNLRWDS